MVRPHPTVPMSYLLTVHLSSPAPETIGTLTMRNPPRVRVSGRHRMIRIISDSDSDSDGWGSEANIASLFACPDGARALLLKEPGPLLLPCPCPPGRLPME